MWNADESWKPWAQHNSSYRPILHSRPLHPPPPPPAPYFHRSVAPSASFAPSSFASSANSYNLYSRPAPYYKPPTFYNNEPASTSSYHRSSHQIYTPRALPSLIPMKTPHMELWKDFNAPPKPLEIQLYSKKSARRCFVRWHAVEIAPHLAHTRIIKIYENERLMDTCELDGNICQYSFQTIPGEHYSCEYRIKDARGIEIAEGSIRFRATFSFEEMKSLLNRALNHVNPNRPLMHPFRLLYRCKPKCYWDDIQMRSQNIMRKYIKDDNGQAANPTNGMIYGLFFSARLLPNGSLPSSSPFGNIRMTIPAEVLLNPDRVNLYFSDFYCNRLTHYVTVVICVKGSRTDTFCMDKLIPLSPNNPFVSINYGPRGYEFYVNKMVWVEFYFTENVPISWGKFDKVTPVGLGTSRLGGLPHNKSCTMCNLYPITNKLNLPQLVDPYENDEQDNVIAQAHLEKMVDLMKGSGLKREECEDIVFLTYELVDQVSYDNDFNVNVQEKSTIFGNQPLCLENAMETLKEEENRNHPKTKGIGGKLRNLHHSVMKRVDTLGAAIVKKKNKIKKRFARR